MAQADKAPRTRPEVSPVQGSWVRFDASGDNVSGWFQGVSDVVIPNVETGEQQILKRYSLVDEYGLTYEFLGTAQLNVLMARIPLDAFVVVTFQGIAKSRKGYNVKQFIVELEKGIKLLAEGE